MSHKVPPDYEKKFAGFIQMCADAKRKGIDTILIPYPWVLGDNFDEIMESLSRLADAELALHIAARKEWPERN